jgi:hypothetical protein
VTYYEQGNYYEARTATLLRAEGYEVWQTRQSRGAADLIAIKPGQVVLVQVKSGIKAISHDGWNSLYRLSLGLRAVPVVADWRERTRAEPGRGRVMHLRRITGMHQAHKQTWPCVTWHLDAVEAAARADGRTVTRPPIATCG